MEENSYFRQALGNFTFDAASGAAIRHLADLGLTAWEIKKKLTYPTPIEKIVAAYTEHLLSKGTLRKEAPGLAEPEPYEYICEQNEYGKTQYRRVPVSPKQEEDMAQKKLTVYVYCHFTESGVLKKELSQYLSGKQTDYLASIDWKQGIRYHILDERMQEILNRLPKEYTEEA